MVTRVTNMMLTNTLLSNLSMNLNRMDKLQNQLSSGRKYGHISDDPSALIYAQSARNKLARLSHYQGSVEAAQSWLTQAEAGVMELNKVVGAIYEELISTGGAKDIKDKPNIAAAVEQLLDHYVDTLNTVYGDRFVFGGYNTPGDYAAPTPDSALKPFHFDKDTGYLWFNGENLSLIDGTMDPDAFKAYIEDTFREDVVTFDVGPAIEMDVTIGGLDLIFFTTMDDSDPPQPVVRNMFNVLLDVYNAIIDNEGTDELTKRISLVQDGQNHLLTKAAEIGGRQRRLELLEARYAQDDLNYEKMRSDAEDADMAEVIMFLKMAETVYQSALSAGARVIQPTLMDFLR